MAQQPKKVERVSYTMPTGTKVTSSKEAVDKLKAASSATSTSKK